MFAENSNVINNNDTELYAFQSGFCLCTDLLRQHLLYDNCVLCYAYFFLDVYLYAVGKMLKQ